MKYRIGKKTASPPSAHRPMRLRGKQTARKIRAERIRLFDLFSSTALPKGKAPSRLRLAFWRTWLAWRARWHRAAEKRRAKREKKPQYPSLLPALCGAFCASLAVCLLSAVTVLYVLLFSRFTIAYREVTVPDLVGETLSDSLWDPTLFEAEITYQYHNDLPEGTVLSQSPKGNVIRRIRKKSPCSLSLVVSLGRHSVIMEDLRGMSLRDAELRLKNQAVSLLVQTAYSDTVPKGIVIGTEPAVGGVVQDGERATLTVSLGKQIRTHSVPDLLGLSESDALSRLATAGISTETISYERSPLPAGTVTSQDPPPHSEIPEGATVSFTVSAGIGYAEKTVPDLYGLSVEEAKRALSDVGLVCGGIYAVAGSGAANTVIAQSLPPNTPITSAITTVDLYICA